MAIQSQSLGLHMPAEWAKHRCVWLAWPSDQNLWQENLPAAQTEFVAFCRAIVADQGEPIHLLVPNAAAYAQASERLSGLPVQYHEIPFGDIWLRDTGPIFMKTAQDESMAVSFGFNGWGKKYELPFDAQVSGRIAQASGLRKVAVPWILEGGSIEVDGEGTCLTSEQCLLNPNRNPKMSKADIEHELKNALGIEKVLWLKDGMLNDHTDGHIDTIARYIAPAQVMCMAASGLNDPNKVVYEQISTDLSRMTDARGRRLKVIQIPSPGRVENEDGEVMPASHVNFYIGNKAVIVPIYGTAFDDQAVAAIAPHFPRHKTIGLSAKSILSGGGAFHCISQQEPV